MYGIWIKKMIKPVEKNHCNLNPPPSINNYIWF